MSKIRAWAAMAPGQKLERYEYDPGPLADDEVEVAVKYCGVCHSDLSMIDNEWKFTTYTIVPGHEVVGRIVALGGTLARRHVRCRRRPPVLRRHHRLHTLHRLRHLP